MATTYPPVRERLFSRVVTNIRGCQIWQGSTDKKGYGKIGWNCRDCRVHRVSYELHWGPIPKGHLVCHSCDTPPCVTPEHLWSGTSLQNMRDMIEKGRDVHASGEDASASRFTNAQVVDIREYYAANKRYGIVTKMAREHRVNRSTIYDILWGKTYSS